MTDSEIRAKLTEIFRETFDDPALVLTDATTAKDVALWDSLNHVDLVVSVEKSFRVSFTTKEIKGLENVGNLVRLISTRVS
jgi:acyl carrier protein